ncbi:hypothetical protein CHUAL_004131 [Chamberlinius hualienensis]
MKCDDNVEVSTLHLLVKMASLETILFSIVAYVYVILSRFLSGEFWLNYDHSRTIGQINLIPVLMREPLMTFNVKNIHGSAGEAVNSLEKTLSYLSKDIENIDNKAIFDILIVISMVEGQLRSVELDDIRDDYIKTNFNKLQNLTASILQRGLPAFKNFTPDYSEMMGDLINVDLWTDKVEWKQILEINFNQSLFVNDLAIGGHTDKCLSEISKCNVTDICWKYMTERYQSGYMTTHQLIYVMAAKKKCSEQSEDMIIKYNQTSFDNIIGEMCANIDIEAKNIQEKNFPEENRDLYCEQVMFCGMNGYGSVYTNTSLSAITSWQSSNGCFKYSVTQLAAHATHISERKRVKRNEYMKTDGCFPHFTVVCAGALAGYVRYFLQNS